MKNFDKTLGIILAIVSILSCVANYFNVLTTLLLVTDFIVGIFATALSMMETYHHQPYFNRNSGWFWFLCNYPSRNILCNRFRTIKRRSWTISHAGTLSDNITNTGNILRRYWENFVQGRTLCYLISSNLTICAVGLSCRIFCF